MEDPEVDEGIHANRDTYRIMLPRGNIHTDLGDGFIHGGLQANVRVPKIHKEIGDGKEYEFAGDICDIGSTHSQTTDHCQCSRMYPMHTKIVNTRVKERVITSKTMAMYTIESEPVEL